MLQMMKPRSYILANLIKLNCKKSNYFSQPGRKMNAITTVFFLMFSETGAGCQSTYTNSLKRINIPSSCFPTLLKKGLHRKKNASTPFPKAQELLPLFPWTYLNFFVNTIFGLWIS